MPRWRWTSATTTRIEALHDREKDDTHDRHAAASTHQECRQAYTTLPITLPTTALPATDAPTLAASHTTRHLSRNSVLTVPRYPSLRVGWKIEIPGHKEDRTYELQLF
jgi:hypothetical protein